MGFGGFGQDTFYDLGGTFDDLNSHFFKVSTRFFHDHGLVFEARFFKYQNKGPLLRSTFYAQGTLSKYQGF